MEELKIVFQDHTYHTYHTYYIYIYIYIINFIYIYTVIIIIYILHGDIHGPEKNKMDLAPINFFRAHSFINLVIILEAKFP